MFKQKKIAALSVVIGAVLSLQPAWSCTRVVDAVKDHAVMVGRNMDWYGEMSTTLFVYPRGVERVGSLDDRPLEWKSRYGSVISASYDIFTTDGFNEKGLGAHMLWLEKSDYGKRDMSQPGLFVFQWAQYYLDNFATVDEAVKFTQQNSFQIVPFFLKEKQRWVNLHLAIEDATGDSAIIEYTDGKPHIYHQRANTVLTNDPDYPAQLAHLKEFSGFGGDKPLPGTSEPEDRFVRAAYHLQKLPTPNTDKEQIAHVFSVIHNAAQPYRGPTPEKPFVAGTTWSTVSDLTHGVYYFKFADELGTIWTDLKHFDLREGAPVMRLSLSAHLGLSGDVSNLYENS